MKGFGVSCVSIYNGFHMSDQAGNQEEQFLEAFDQYADALFRHAVIRLSDREVAIDAVHDAFTKAWNYIRQGHEVDTFRPFLYKVLNNLIIDEYRKRKESSLDALLEKEGVDEGSFTELHQHSLDEAVDALDAKRIINRISELPDTYREVLTLRYVDGLNPKDIAELIEETENVVSVRIHRGVNMLKKLIAREADKHTHET